MMRGTQEKLDHRLAVSLLMALLALLAAARSVSAQSPTPEGQPTPGPGSPIPHTLVGRSNCLICHAQGFGGAVKVPTDHAGRTNEKCQDCHLPAVLPGPTPAPGTTPGAIPTPIIHPAGDGANSCLDCHISLKDKHAEISDQWQKSVHGKAQIGCADCHGGDPRTDEMNLSMAPEAGFIGVPPRLLIPKICGGCHSDVERMRQYNLPTDQYIKYADSVHGKKLFEQNETRVAVCTDCHSTHDVKPASDPSADVYPLNVPALCARCHADATLMEPFGLPTNQYDLYKTSVHGEAVLNRQDLRAATCASCHGSHAAKPPTDVEVVNVCGKCHTATQDYYNQSRHSKIGDNAPKCWTCHGTHDIFKPDESVFIHPQPPDNRHCGTCHVDNVSFRMDKARFALPEDRRCTTCHHEGSMIMAQVLALRDALTEADKAYREGEEMIRQAATRGMIVTEAEAKLAEARTSLISARATLHTTKLPVVSKLTDAALASAATARDSAAGKVSENLFRRQAMVVAVGAIVIIIITLSLVKRELDQQLKEKEMQSLEEYGSPQDYPGGSTA